MSYLKHTKLQPSYIEIKSCYDCPHYTTVPKAKCRKSKRVLNLKQLAISPKCPLEKSCAS